MSQQSINGLNIPSIQNKRSVTFQQNTTPAMQGNAQEQVRQVADNNYLANRLKASQDADPLVTFGLGTALWYLIGQMMEKVNPKFGGSDYRKYETSLGGKIGGFFDKLTNNAVGRKTDSVLKAIDKKLAQWEKNSKILYTLRHHSTSPEWQFAKVPGKGLLGFLSADADQVIEEFLKPIGSNVQKLEQYGLKPNEIESFIESIKGKTLAEQAFEIQKKELALLGGDARVVAAASPQNITLKAMQDYASHLKLKELGFKSLKDFSNLKGKFVDNPVKVWKLFHRVALNHPEWKVSIWRNNTGLTNNKFLKGTKYVVTKLFGEKAGDSVTKFLNKTFSHLLGRNVSFAEYSNKYKIALGRGAKSRLGRFATLAHGWITEGATNRFGGGKLVVAMQAAIFADMLIHAFNAPKGEKVKTLAERAVNDFSYFVALTLGIIGMHKLGGFKFAGLDNAGKKEYLKALEKFNKNVDAGLYKNKEAYNIALKILKKKSGYKNIKNPITKLLNKCARFLNLGNYRHRTYKSNAKWNMNWIRKLGNGNILGVPLRILIPFAVVTPFVVNLTTTTAHKIFGRPTHSVLDEDKEEENNAEDKTNSIDAQQKNSDSSVTSAKNPTNMGRQPRNPQEYQDTNLIKIKTNGQQMPDSVAKSQAVIEKTNSDGDKYIPNSNSEIDKNDSTVNNTITVINSPEEKNKELEPVRTYIPSPEGMVPNSVDITAADKAMADADNAEKFVNETLAQLRH